MNVSPHQIVKPVSMLVIWTEPRTIDNFVLETQTPQLSLTQHLPIVCFCRKETQELPNYCPLHRYVSTSNLSRGSQGLPPSHQGQ